MEAEKIYSHSYIIEKMGQIFSNLCRWLCPKARYEAQRHELHDHQASYQKFYLDENQLQSHYVHISNNFPPIWGSSTEVLGNHDSNVVVDLSSGYEEDAKREMKKKKKKKELILEKNVTATVDCVSSVSREIVVRKLGPYTSDQRLLLVGEGDFSFSASLAVAFGTSAFGIVATSLNSEDFLIKNYRKFLSNKAKLETRGSIVLHGVNAMKMVNHPVLSSLVFDCIIFNFPHVGKFGKSNSELRMHQKLVRGFLRNAKKMVVEDGEIHITSKSSGFFSKWDIPKLGSDHGLYLIHETKFVCSKYPGYSTKYGFGGDKDFDCNPSKTYKFGLSPY